MTLPGAAYAMEVLSFALIALGTALALWLLSPTSSSGDKLEAKKQLPPGPWTLPIIGSFHHVISSLPHRTLMALSRRHGPLMFLKLGEVPTAVVSSAEVAEIVMKTKDLTFASRPRNVTQDIVGCGGKGIVFAPYGDHWREMRKICIVELLSAKQVKRMESIREEEVAHLLRSVSAATGTGSVNLGQMVTTLGNDVISRAVFGGKCARQSEYLDELSRVATLLGGFCMADLFPSSWLVRWLSTGERQLRRSYGSIQGIIADIIHERKRVRFAQGTCHIQDEDLLDLLLRQQEEDSWLTSESIGVVIFDIFGAASDTSRIILEWAMSELLNNPEALAKAQQEVRQVLGPNRGVITNPDLVKLHYMRMVIKEAFRLHPPVPLLVPREAIEDCEIMGFVLPKGTNIFVNVFAISRDPRYWDNPEEFKPERFENNKVDYNGTNFEFTPFGAGRRRCPGILFSTSTVEIVLANLLYHFDWMLFGKTSAGLLDMSEKFGINVSRRSELRLRAVPQVPFKAV